MSTFTQCLEQAQERSCDRPPYREEPLRLGTLREPFLQRLDEAVALLHDLVLGFEDLLPLATLLLFQFIASPPSGRSSAASAITSPMSAFATERTRGVATQPLWRGTQVPPKVRIVLVRPVASICSKTRKNGACAFLWP